MLQIPDKIYDDIDLVREIPRKEEEAIINQINIVVDEIKDLISDQRSSEGEYDLSELFYLLGYALYFHPEKKTNSAIYQEIEKSFLSALEINNQYPMAWLYFGYNAYDKRRFSEAQKRFLMVKEDSLDPYWNLKLLEIQLCCSIKLEGLEEFLDKVEIFISEILVEAAKQLPEDDIYPISLANAIEESEFSLSPSNKLRSAHLFEKIDKAVYGNEIDWYK